VASNDVTIAQTSQDKDLKFTVNDGGVTKTPIEITGSTGTVTINGNLIITGSYDKSSVDVSTYVDAFIGLNEGNGSNVDGGLIVERSSDEARIFWDQSEGYWSAGVTGSFSQVIRLADTTDDGGANHSKVLKATSAGGLTMDSVTLVAVGSDITSSTSTSSTSVPTTGQVAKSLKLWGGSVISDDSSNSIAGNRYVETSAPTSGQGADGDLWFVREA
jgi:hypothetical protein